MSTGNKSPKKRIEYRGKNIRISRTGGLSATKTVSKDGYSATVNTNHGLRLNKRLFRGGRIGIQNGNYQFIGRYKSGPFNFNISKSGVSTSIRNKRGSYNLFKPNYSSFKLSGVQFRGKNAAILQLIFMTSILIINIIKFLWRFILKMFWFMLLTMRWFLDFSKGFYNGFSNKYQGEHSKYKNK